MSSHYDLICEYIHCFGKTKIKLGEAITLSEAEEWKKEKSGSNYKPSLPENDPIRTCPVVRCPLKKQTPQFGFSEIED